MMSTHGSTPLRGSSRNIATFRHVLVYFGIPFRQFSFVFVDVVSDRHGVIY